MTTSALDLTLAEMEALASFLAQPVTLRLWRAWSADMSVDGTSLLARLCAAHGRLLRLTE